MYWNSVGEFLAMGGYGGYVWGSFLVTGAVLGAETWLVQRRARRALRSAQHGSRSGEAA